MSLVHARKGRSESGNISDSIQDEHFDSSNEGAGGESDYSNRSDTEGSEGAEDQEERRVDDDEDRSNPQYIPKRGTFYEHDDRTASSRDDEVKDGSEAPGGEGSDASGSGEVGRGSERETPTELRRQRGPRKSDTCDKWSHDKYNEDDQTPKSRDELVSIYGYDIRNEDGPPHARRNRRYGRGPNKYTRTWEDEEAYRRASAAVPVPKKPPSTGEEDFPALDKAPARKINPTRNPKPARQSPRQVVENGGGDRGGREEGRKHGATPTKPPAAGPKLPIENLTISTTVNNSSNQSRKVTTANILRSSQLNQAPLPREAAQLTHNITQPTRRTMQPQLTIPQQQPASQQQQGPPITGPAQLHQQKPPTPQQLAPPLLPKQPVLHQQAQGQTAAPQQQSAGGEAGRGKRYSSLRQRPIMEGYTPQAAPPVQQAPTAGVPQAAPPPTQQPPPQQHRYVPEYQGGPAQQPGHQASPVPQMQLPQQQMMHQQVHPVPPTQPGPPQQHPQQVLARGLPLLAPQEAQLVAPQHAVHTHAMTGQLAMMPAQYIQGGTSAVYAAPPPPAVYAQPAPPYPHPLYPHHNYAPHHTTPPPPAAAPGITYYGPADHQLAADARPQRRPTAAIPILPPPPSTKSGSGQQDKESIDRIVDNMFVRKQRPQGTAFSGADTAKSQIEQKSRAASEGSKRTQDSSKESSLTKSSSPTDSLSSSLISTDSRHSTDKSADLGVEQPVESGELQKSIEKLSIKEAEPAETVTSASPKEPVSDLEKSLNVTEGAKAVSNPSSVSQPIEVSVTGDSKEIV